MTTYRTMNYKSATTFYSPEFGDAVMTSGLNPTRGLLGKGYRFDFSEYPHLLIAGSSGSGKSVLVNSLVLSMMYASAPTQSSFVFIDPKMVEFQIYENSPHLYMPVCTEMERAIPTLEKVEKEMMRRYKELKEKRLRKYEGQHIYVVIDELAQLIDYDKKATQRVLSSLARLGRASGIHLIVATQYPTRAYISNQILTNFDCRVVMRCDSALSYRTVLGVSLPADLIPQKTGDGVLIRAGKFAPFHCPYVSEKDYDWFIEHSKFEVTNIRKTGGLFSRLFSH